MVNDVNSHINHIQSNYSCDTKSSELLNWIAEKLNSISKIARRDVRFDYLFIQSEIDKLYKIDNSLTGFIIRLDFNKEKEPNWDDVNDGRWFLSMYSNESDEVKNRHTSMKEEINIKNDLKSQLFP